jgi:hypothetical protein
MEELHRANLRLTECYRGAANQEEAETNCQQHLDYIKNLFADNKMEVSNVLKNMWIEYHSKYN